MAVPTELLDQVAPFHLVWSQDGELLHLSSALRGVWHVEPGDAGLATTIEMLRPFEQTLDPAWLPELTEIAVHLRAEASDRVVKGQIIEHDDAWLFLGNPRVSSVAELENMDLKLSDLPIHDAAGDLLIAIEANRVSLAESQRRANQLSAAVNDLQAVNHMLSGFVPGAMLEKLDLDMGSEGSVEFSAEAVGRFIERLQHALDFREAFMATMSHELRTPLNAILGISEVMQEGVYGDITAKQLEMLGTITKSGDHLLSLINDILDLSKIEAGEAELRLRECHLEALCETALRMSRPRSDNPKTTYRFEYRSSHQTISVDQRRIRQVLLNLLSNAAKFTDEGEISLTVDDLPEEDSVRIQVRDTGIGIEPHHLERLFEPFYQVDHGLSRAHQGTGLGLAITQRVLQLHGGRIEAESERGVGSTFSIIVPITAHRIHVPSVLEERSLESRPKTTTGENPIPSLEVMASLQAGAHALEGKRVLVVDAEPMNRAHLVDYLQQVGLEIEEADNGQVALSAILTRPPALVVMDIEIAGIGGLDLLRCLRLIPQTQALPILVLTGRAMPIDQQQCLAAGANEFLAKPCRISVLFPVVRRLLSA